MVKQLECTEDMDVYATWADKLDGLVSEFVESVDLDPDSMPEELEINGIVYKAEV